MPAEEEKVRTNPGRCNPKPPEREPVYARDRPVPGARSRPGPAIGHRRNGQDMPFVGARAGNDYQCLKLRYDGHGMSTRVYRKCAGCELYVWMCGWKQNEI